MGNKEKVVASRKSRSSDAELPDDMSGLQAIVVGQTDSRASIARLVVADEAAEVNGDNGTLLRMALEAMQTAGIQGKYLLTPAGFLRAALSESASPLSGWDTDTGSFAAISETAVRRVDAVMTPSMRHLASQLTSYIVFGVDVTKGQHPEPHGEASVLFDTRAGEANPITGKSFPTGDQERVLIRNPDVASHVVQVGGEDVAVLVCHDLMSWGPRSKANRKGKRASVGTQMEDTVSRAQPNVVLHQAHTVSTVRTWTAAWSELRKHNTSLLASATAFRYLTKEFEQPGDRLSQKLLLATRAGGAVDVVLGSAPTMAALQ